MAVTLGGYTFSVSEAFESESTFTTGRYMNQGMQHTLRLGRQSAQVDTWPQVLNTLVGTVQTVVGLFSEDVEVYVSSESSQTSDTLTLIVYATDYDTTGVL